MNTPDNKDQTPTAESTSVSAIRLNVSVRADMAEFSAWHPQQIRAFMQGVAQVLAAQPKK